MILHPPEVPMGAPGFCIICQSTPGDRTKTPVANCMRFFDAGDQVSDALEGTPRARGTKFLCGDCVRTAINVFGWTQPEDANEYLAEAYELQLTLNELEYELAVYKNFRDTAHELATLGFQFEEVECSDAPEQTDSQSESVPSTKPSSKSKQKKSPPSEPN